LALVDSIYSSVQLGTYHTIKATLPYVRQARGSYIHVSATLHYNGMDTEHYRLSPVSHSPLPSDPLPSPRIRRESCGRCDVGSPGRRARSAWRSFKRHCARAHRRHRRHGQTFCEAGGKSQWPRLHFLQSAVLMIHFLRANLWGFGASRCLAWATSGILPTPRFGCLATRRLSSPDRCGCHRSLRPLSLTLEHFADHRSRWWFGTLAHEPAAVPRKCARPGGREENDQGKTIIPRILCCDCFLYHYLYPIGFRAYRWHIVPNA
jgi:hypothetical protein